MLEVCAVGARQGLVQEARLSAERRQLTAARRSYLEQAKRLSLELDVELWIQWLGPVEWLDEDANIWVHEDPCATTTLCVTDVVIYPSRLEHTLGVTPNHLETPLGVHPCTPGLHRLIFPIFQ